MTNPIRIRRRTSGAIGAPSSLLNAEIAFNEVDSTLYYGVGTGGAGGSATTIIPIGGSGAFVGLTGDQTIAGIKTFSSTIVGNISGNAGTATKLATARTIQFTGDATASGSFDGSANYSQALTLATVNSNVGTYTKLTVNAKGLVTAASNASLSDLTAATGDLSIGGYKLTNVAEPVASTDAATKNYVDSVAQGLDIKGSVKAATTANITLSGAQTIDGISIVAGDRVLVKNQSTASANGIYVAAAGSWARSTDADTWNELVSAFTFVEQGTSNADTSWVCTVDAGGTLGSTAVTFAQFGAASAYSAGNGLQLSGNSFSVLANGSSIDVSSSGVRISATYAGQTSITTLGTIATGTWNGSTVGVAYGGTGATTLTGLLKGNGTSAFTAAVAGTDYVDMNTTIDGGTF